MTAFLSVKSKTSGQKHCLQRSPVLGSEFGHLHFGQPLLDPKQIRTSPCLRLTPIASVFENLVQRSVRARCCNEDSNSLIYG